ncbi:FAD-dependent monooxygenase [Halostagnicola sp. A-GB9-2]|uniref:FAD-dependent monooxygenase n=1 Tax=Halostagnicola sp. A-GB9-2 TaxID=3048066 RepID=UPI0024C0D8AE|nr:FAD-dependent monooxygenase [Halostagnicola sp. A-GB9-2]MDJ1433835.1 FAD-dependent monooxygenase [Halostagnicola sp. A-GB9-2]
MTEATIIGGGIGGLSLAVGLKQRGIDFHVYEATDEYKPAGAGIIWQINTMQALDRLGLAADVQKHGASHAGYSVRDASDEFVMENDWTEFEDEFGFRVHGIYRSKFQEILVSKIGEENITMGKECIGVEQDGDSVTVQFADGTDVDAAFAVGADGINSAVRESLFPGHSLEYLDCVTHRGLPEWRPPAEVEDKLWNVFAEDGHVGYVPLEADTRKGYWFYTMHSEEIESKDPADVKDGLLERAASKPDRVGEMIDATPVDSIKSVDAPYVPPMETWSKGDVTLLGDASHGMTPHAAQGGGMAIEDALALSIALDEHDSLEDAQEWYESVRIERASEFVERSRRNGLGAISEGADHIEKMRHAPAEAMKQQVREDLTLGF